MKNKCECCGNKTESELIKDTRSKGEDWVDYLVCKKCFELPDTPFWRKMKNRRMNK